MILFVRDLTVIDFSYLSATRGMLGESYIVDVELHGELNETSMVFDFGKVKKVIKQAIDQLVDHKLALPADSGRLSTTVQSDIQRVSFHSDRGMIHIASPAQAFVSIPGSDINESSVGLFLEQQIKPLLPDNITKLLFTLRPEAINGFYYHYSHGLKKHDGNCQRIAHGHRSAIQIFSDGMLSPRLNKLWSERWQDIYLGTTEDLCPAEQLQYIKTEDNHYTFRYQAAQGMFELSLPVTHCELLPCDTTVECLADYIAEQLKKQDATKTYKVIAYEGVGKGAVAYS
jgi:6-pyruvoyl-tetrahydropterin synthase